MRLTSLNRTHCGRKLSFFGDQVKMETSVPMGVWNEEVKVQAIMLSVSVSVSVPVELTLACGPSRWARISCAALPVP